MPTKVENGDRIAGVTLHIGDGIVLEIECTVGVVVAVGVFNAAQEDILDRHVLHRHAGVGDRVH